MLARHAMATGEDESTREPIAAGGPGWRHQLLLMLRLVFAVALIVTLIMTLRPHHPPIVGSLFWWKFGDCAAFAVLTLVAIVAFPTVSLFRLGEYLSFLAALVEIGQGAVTVGRDANILDWLIETIVIALILLLSSPPQTARRERRRRDGRER